MTFNGLYVHSDNSSDIAAMESAQIRVLRHNRPEIVRVLAGDSDLNHIVDRMDELGTTGKDSPIVADWMRENVRSTTKPVTQKVYGIRK